MRNHLLRASLCLLIAAPLYAREEAGKVVKDTWDAAYLEGAPCGYVHTTIHEKERDGRKLFSTTLEMNLTLKRSGTLVPMRVQTGNEETTEGKITSVFFTQFLDKGKEQTLIGEVKGDKFQLRVGDRLLGPAKPWNDKALGLYAQDRLYKERKVKPDDTVEYLNFELQLQMAVPIKAHVKEPEEIEVLEIDNKNPDKPIVQRVRKKLLRIEAVPDKIEVGGKAFPLPRMIAWYDNDLQPLRGLLDVPGLGKITLYRATEVLAKQKVNARELPDLLVNNLIKLNKAIENVHEAKSVVYRITAENDDDPQTIFLRDTRQRVLQTKDSTFDLEVKALRGPVPVETPGKVDGEFLKSSFYLDSDSARVKDLVKEAVDDETDTWKKCLRIEKWVHKNMTGDSGIGYVTASTIARDRKGDCRQHSMLCAAMCRAAGVPARTAIGLVYGTDDQKAPILAFHMWTEVWVKNQWLALDAVLGQGGIGPGHLKITDHSWADTQTQAFLVPLLRAMSKIKAEVVSVEE